MFKYVLHRFFKNKKSYLLIVIIIITFLIMSISPYLTGSFVDFMINNKDVHRVVYLSSIIMLIGIVGVVLAYCKNTLSVKITSQVSFDLLRDITKHFEKVKLSVVETIDSTYLTQQINTDGAFSALSVHIHLIVIIPDNPTAKIQPQSLFQQRSCTFRWYHYCFALPIGVFACTSRIISSKHVPQDVSAPSIVNES